MSILFNDLDDAEDNTEPWKPVDNASIIFLVDATDQMHKNGQLLACLKTFRKIVKEKCLNNRKDNISLVLFGTKKTNCQLENIMVLQKFTTISIDTLKNIDEILQDHQLRNYEGLESTDEYPLNNALLHAFQVLHSVKFKTKMLNAILLCTCHDDPNVASRTELRKIEHLVETFQNSRTKFLVVGLKNSWDSNIFYKDLQVLSGTFDKDNYRNISLEDLEQTIISSAKSTCTLPWKITPNIAVPVCIINLSSKYKYPTRVTLRKDNNEILKNHRIFQKLRPEDITFDKSEELSKGEIIRKDTINFHQTYARKFIHFKPHEIKQMRILCNEKSIEILAMKPIVCDPAYHIKPCHLIKCSTLCSLENKNFFRLFVYKCHQKEVMPICKVVTTTSLYIAMMIPSVTDGGFYMYKIPLSGQVRNLNNRLKNFIFGGEYGACATVPEAVDIYKKLIKHTKADFDPTLFKNPKLVKFYLFIEALALDKALDPLPPDTTLPPPANDEIEYLSRKMRDLFDLPDKETRKRALASKSSSNKRSKLDPKAALQSGNLDQLTVVDLKEMLKEIKKSTTGTKSVLIERIKKHYKM